MDIQYRSCRYCYAEIPDCYLIDGLCDACVRTETTNQPPVVSPATPTCSEGIAPAAATVDAGHSEQGGGAS